MANQIKRVMNELSIEEKAKAYDEAREKIAIRFGSNVADEIFSQFEMSEDERIRKEIIDFATKANNGVTSILANNYDFNKWIAWLEKQGEQKEATCVAEIIDRLTEKEQEILFRELEMQKVQKPAENKGMNLVEEEMTPFQKKVFCIIDTAIEEEQGLKQVCDELFRLAHDEIIQKPAWSEEDEFFFGWISATLDNNTRHCPKSKETNKSCKKWLQSLKDRVQPQPKQEWSEEDENFLKEAIRMIEMPGSWFKGKDLQNKIVNWLNSLRPQSHWTGTTKEQIDTIAQHLENLGNVAMANELFNLHIEPYWKPSDEELYSLKEVMNIVGSKYKSCLNSLYSDLMKLREE